SQTRPAPVVPPHQLSSAPSAIPPVLTSTPPVVTSPPAQNTPRNLEEPAPIVIQVRPNDSPQTPLNASLETEVKSPESEQVPQNQNDESLPVRSAEEALQILESHRNQNEEVTPTTPQPPVASQPIVIQVQVKPTPEKDSTTTPITSPRVRSAEEALQILQNHRNKTQSANSKPSKSTLTTASTNTGTKPVNLPNENAPADTLDTIVAKLKAKHNSSSSFNAQKALADADIVYVVQIAALINRKDVNNRVFRGLSGLSTEKFRDFHRYLYRPTASYQQAKIAQRHVISKGFTTAFIVAYVNGTRTSALEVAKLNNQN
ncbi:MAG: hypothetical protein CMB95_03080, partial [Flavobacteriaceae bacterium]|nr:hypothetical protein [Flavobacteriaceae bacterium]